MTAYLDPTREAFDAFKTLPRDEPIHMLNLIKLHKTARYPDGREVSGAVAYREYGRLSGPIFQRVGGQIVWRGQAQNMLIGPSDEMWDISFIAVYPHAGAFLDMVTDPDYQGVAVKHRQAAVATSRLIRHSPLGGSGEFG